MLCGYAVLDKHTQPTIAGREGAIGRRGHPRVWLNHSRWPDLRRERSANHIETQGVGCYSRRCKRGSCKRGERPIDIHLYNQVGAIDVGFVPVISIGPAQDCPQVVVA